MFSGGSSSHCCGLPPSQTTIWLSRPICSSPSAAVGVDELPDDAGADERDRHRHEDQRLGERLEPGPVDQHGVEQADRGGQQRAPAPPRAAVLSSTVRVSGCGEHPGVVVQADELASESAFMKDRRMVRIAGTTRPMASSSSRPGRGSPSRDPAVPARRGELCRSTEQQDRPTTASEAR